MFSYKTAAISLAALGASIYGVQEKDTFLAEKTTSQIEESVRNLDDWEDAWADAWDDWEDWDTSGDWYYNDDWEEDWEDLAGAATGMAVGLLIIIILIPICICVGVGVCIWCCVKKANEAKKETVQVVVAQPGQTVQAQ